MTALASPRLLPVDTLDPHPDNPRFELREQQLETLAELIRAHGFDSSTPLLVRQLGGRYQIVSGHHRALAARAAELAAVPCVVRELTDEQAWVLLATANEQADLDLVERARHFYGYIQRFGRAKGGRGQQGGVSEAARAFGYSRPNAHKLLKVGEIDAVPLETCHDGTRFSDDDLKTRGAAFAAAHAAPPAVRAAVKRALLEKGWTAADTEHWVKGVGELADAVGEGNEGWLALGAVAERYLATREFSPRTAAARG